MSGDADAMATRAIRNASIAAGGLGVVLSPIPFADELALLPLYAWLTMRIARVHGRGAREVPWKPLAKTALLGLALRATVNAPVAAMPGVSAAMNAATAVGLTGIYGACVDHVCRDPSTPAELRPKDILDALRARTRRAAASAARPAEPTERREQKEAAST